MDFHIYHHIVFEDNTTVLSKLAEIKAGVTAVLSQGKAMSAQLQQIVDSEGAEATALGQLATVVQTQQAQIATLTQQLADALSGTTLPPAVQAKVDEAFAASAANTATVAGILAALVPPAPVTP
jgi:uncharacterized protein YcbX